jgi:hypothetical protein
MARLRPDDWVKQWATRLSEMDFHNAHAAKKAPLDRRAATGRGPYNRHQLKPLLITQRDAITSTIVGAALRGRPSIQKGLLRCTNATNSTPTTPHQLTTLSHNARFRARTHRPWSRDGSSYSPLAATRSSHKTLPLDRYQSRMLTTPSCTHSSLTAPQHL